jgi:hypothetical protein
MSNITNRYNELFVSRKGVSDEAYMITKELITIFPIDCSLVLDKNNIITTNKPNYINIPKMLSPEIPNFTMVEGYFHNSANMTTTILTNNILGNNSIFYTKVHNIQIPIISFSDQLLEFFGCKVINNGDVFSIDNKKEMPFFKVLIGKNYKNDYLLKEGLGDGFYIEKHDTPHIHQPVNINSNGFIVLAKRLENLLLLSKIKIPFGKALYIPANVYHNDSLLIGEYNVLYTKTDNYQTYLFKTYEDKIVNII